MKTAASAIAIIAALALSSTAARAACEVKHGSAADVLSNSPTGSHLETDCASAADVTAVQSVNTAQQLQINTATTTNTAQGTAITALQASDGLQNTALASLQAANIAQDAVIATKADTTYVDTKNAAQDTVIATKAATTYVDTKNAAQDAVIATKASTAYVDSQNGAQDAVIATKASTAYVNSQNAIQDARLNSFNGTGGSLESWASGVDATNASQSSAINALQGDVSKLNGRVDEAFEGVAMALAMESPQVDPGKHFGIALNYGNFEGENAFAAAAKIRFDDTWAGTAGVGLGGSGTVGLRAGVQAQW
jgi:hypothetical protein